MFRKFLISLGLGIAMATSAVAADLPHPYKQEGTNFIYNLLFCDDLELFRPKSASHGAFPVDLLFENAPDAKAVERLANDSNAESRTRMLAYNWLRQRGLPVPKKILLGVIVEVPLDSGLDVLAAYADGRVRYINQTGGMSIFEDAPKPIVAKARELLSSAQVAVNIIGPWDKPRLPPPPLGNARITFLVSDGLYFGEGKFDDLASDPMSGPIMKNATGLLMLIARTSH